LELLSCQCEFLFSLYHYIEILTLLQGDGAPSDVDPAALKRAGCKRFNTSQTMPRTSTELQKNVHSYEQLQISLGRLFDWLRQTVSNLFYMLLIIFFSQKNFQLEELLPKEYKILSQYCDILLADGIASAYPFGGWVINFNVSTLIHRNYQDLKLCLIIVASDSEKGDLCL
jgi:hypothetical protein